MPRQLGWPFRLGVTQRHHTLRRGRGLQIPTAWLLPASHKSMFAAVLLLALPCGTARTAAQETPVKTAAIAEKLPGDLARLRAIDSTIEQDIRYASTANFTGAALAGYGAAECILTRGAAMALSRVQGELRQHGLSLKVYDCFRPKRAVRSMLAWISGAGPDDSYYHPHVPRGQLVAQGYVAETSGHSRGDTIDLTLVRTDKPQPAPQIQQAALTSCIAAKAERRPDSTVDMGTDFDCFDGKSATNSAQISPNQRAQRTTLLKAMERGGFRNYPREWWHFTFGAGNGPSYDFSIKGSPTKWE